MSNSAGVTLRDVARHAEVSLATVSMVLNRSEQISPRTRRRVEAALDKLHYRRRSAGRPRGPGARMTNIALIHPRYGENPVGCLPSITLRWMDLIREALARKGYQLSLFGGQIHVDRDPLFSEMAERGSIHGAVLLASLEDGYREWLLERGIPLVVINRRPVRGEFSFVEVDNHGGGALAADWLLSLGHARVAVISDGLKSPFIQERVAGFDALLAERGVPPVLRQVMQGRNDETERRFCQQVIDQGVTGVFCSHDGLALRCLEHWEAQGVRVPAQLSVIGFDATGVATAGGLGISSVGIDDSLLGALTSEQVARLLESEGKIRCLAATLAAVRFPLDTTGMVVPG